MEGMYGKPCWRRSPLWERKQGSTMGSPLVFLGEGPRAKGTRTQHLRAKNKSLRGLQRFVCPSRTSWFRFLRSG